MTQHFGERVVGRENYDKAVRENKGGGNVFGKRVRDSITENGPVGEKKRATEHGPLVVDHAKASGPDGKGDGVSIDQLRNILTENPTFFDSLYEAELARPEGARPDALEIFMQFEIGIKGAGRQEITEEIQGLLGAKKVTAAAQANTNRLMLEQRDAIAKRTEENILIADAPRARALAQRQDDIDTVKKARKDDDQANPTALMQDSQRQETADREGIDIGQGGNQNRLKHPHASAKPDGPVHPESQQPGEHRLGSGYIFAGGDGDDPKDPPTATAKKPAARKAAKKSAKKEK